MRYPLIALAALAAAPMQAQTPMTITDSRSVAVTFPLGARSFADRVVEYTPGGRIPQADAANASLSVGTPDFVSVAQGGFATLGCGGTMTLAFDDNVLVDVDGPDLWIFEVGPNVEGTSVSVSVDGVTWLALGDIQGATAALDLAGQGVPGARYRYVRLVDDGVDCSGNWPGADIDAIGAIGAAERMEMDVPQGDSTRYADTRGQAVVFPEGDLSFADAVVSYTPGGTIPRADAMDPATGLHAPDYTSIEGGGYVTLGCGGSAVYRFDDNTLIDVAGPDLFIFEVGPDVEGTSVAISVDGVNWIEVGAVEGATASLDIAPFSAPGEAYRYVRLIDDGLQCGGQWPGADIDAVGAIGASARVVLDAALLFDFDSADLRPAALAAVAELAQTIRARGVSRVVVEGHTDAQGADAYNLSLSQNRAEAVARALVAQGIAQSMLDVRGHGEARPVAPNTNDAGRQQNRRVEVLLIGVAEAAK